MKPRLPLLLATAILGLMGSSLQAAPAIHYFQQAPKTSSQISSSPGSDHWTITSSGSNKFELPLFFHPDGATVSGPNKISDLTSVSFTTRQGETNSAYGNLYVNIFTRPGTGESKQGTWYDSRLCLETAYASGFDSTKPNTDICTWTSDTADSHQMVVCDTSKGTMGYNGAPTLNQMNQGPVKQYDRTVRDYRNEELKAIYLNFNDSVGGTPGILDLYKFNMTLGGQAYEWNFVASDYVWNVSQSEGLGGLFDMEITLQGGEANANAPLLIMEGTDSNFILNGGTTALTADSSFVLERFTRTTATDSTYIISLDGAQVQKVNNDGLGRDSGLLTFESTARTSQLTVSNSTFNSNNIEANGHGTRFGNLLGSVFTFQGAYDEVAGFATTVTLSNVEIKGNTTTTHYLQYDPLTDQGGGGPQGTMYLNSSKAVLNHVSFTDNTLTAETNSALGGGLCIWATDLTITNSTFTGNKAIGHDGAEGGALYYGDGRWGGNTNVSGRILNSCFINNSAESTAADDSDGIYSQGGAIKLKNTINEKGESFKASLALQDVLFTGNTVKGKSHTENKGGAIYNIGTVLDISVTKSQTYAGNAVLLDGIAKEEQGGFLYLATKEGENQPQGTVNFDIAKDAVLTIGEANKTEYDSIAGTTGTLITKKGSGTLLVNSAMDHYAGALTISEGVLDVNTGLSTVSQITVKSGAALYIGHTTQQNGALSTTTGLGANSVLTAEHGSQLGTHLYNDTANESWNITYDDLAASTKNAFSSYAGNDYQGYTYLLRGKITLTTTTITPGDTINAGEGSTVDLGTTLPDNSVVISGGTVDASKVEGPLTDTQISGASGNLITTESQEVIFTQTGVSGFNVHGGVQEDGTVKTGAALVITKPAEAAPEAEAPAVVLTGQYASQKVAVKEGSLEIKGETAVLGIKGGTVVVGTSDPEAGTTTASRLVNNATILSNVTVGEGSLLKGAGTFMGDLTLAQGAHIYIGNSPGRMEIKDSTFSVNGNELTFCLNGYAPATKTQTGAGYYSNIQMQGGTLAWSGHNTLALDLCAGLLNANTANVSFALLTTDGTTLISGLDQSSLNNVTITQNGPLAGLLNDGSTLSWDPSSNSLILNATLNTALAGEILAADGARIANGLWSSTRSVGNFAHVATSQLDAPRSGASNIWVGGLGDFSSVNGSGLGDGFDYNGGGYALGGDYAFCKCFTGGIAFGQTFGTQKGDMGLSHIDQNGIMMALYGRSSFECSKTTTFFIDGYFTYGDVENKGNFSLMDNSLSGHSKWHDNVFGGGLKAGWNIKMNDKTTLTPFIGIEYLRGEQDDMTLTYTDGSRAWYGGAMQTWTIPVGVTLKQTYSLGGEQYLVPELTVAYEGEAARQDPSVKTNAFGRELKARGITPGRSIFATRAGMRWIMTRNWSAGAYYTLETRSDMTNQGVNASVNYTF